MTYSRSHRPFERLVVGCCLSRTCTFSTKRSRRRSKEEEKKKALPTQLLDQFLFTQFNIDGWICAVHLHLTNIPYAVLSSTALDFISACALCNYIPSTRDGTIPARSMRGMRERSRIHRNVDEVVTDEAANIMLMFIYFDAFNVTGRRPSHHHK